MSTASKLALQNVRLTIQSPCIMNDVRDAPPDLIIQLLLQAQALLIRRISLEKLHLSMLSCALRFASGPESFFLALQKGCPVSCCAIDRVDARDLWVGYELCEEVRACASRCL